MEDLKSQFEATTAKLIDARRKLAECHESVICEKNRLKNVEILWITNGLVGKNEREREAFLHQETADLRAGLLGAEKAERAATLELEILRDCRRQLENILNIELGDL